MIDNLETEVPFSLDSAVASGFGLNGGKDGEPAAALPSIEEAGGPTKPNASRIAPSVELELLRVLIVDDVASTRRFLRAVLRIVSSSMSSPKLQTGMPQSRSRRPSSQISSFWTYPCRWSTEPWHLPESGKLHPVPR